MQFKALLMNVNDNKYLQIKSMFKHIDNLFICIVYRPHTYVLTRVPDSNITTANIAELSTYEWLGVWKTAVECSVQS